MRPIKCPPSLTCNKQSSGRALYYFIETSANVLGVCLAEKGFWRRKRRKREAKENRTLLSV